MLIIPQIVPTIAAKKNTHSDRVKLIISKKGAWEIPVPATIKGGAMLPVAWFIPFVMFIFQIVNQCEECAQDEYYPKYRIDYTNNIYHA